MIHSLIRPTGEMLASKLCLTQTTITAAPAGHCLVKAMICCPNCDARIQVMRPTANIFRRCRTVQHPTQEPLGARQTNHSYRLRSALPPIGHHTVFGIGITRGDTSRSVSSQLHFTLPWTILNRIPRCSFAHVASRLRLAGCCVGFIAWSKCIRYLVSDRLSS